MKYGVHLPLIEFDGGPRTLADLCAYARRAAALDYRVLCANDHLLFRRPWLDGPTALAAVLEASGDMTLATTVALPVIRGPVQTAKLLGALDILSGGGRLIAGVGPGSSPQDYAAAGIAFDTRWRRFDDAVETLRALLGEDANGPPIWIGSWGSDAGLRRVARLGDGWLASAYNTTASAFADNLSTLSELRTPATFPNAVATMWLHVTETRRDAERILADVVAPLLDRTVEAVRDLELLIGPAEQCAQRISAFAEAGAQQIFLWPLADELRQLETFQERVVPLVSAGRRDPPTGRA